MNSTDMTSPTTTTTTITTPSSDIEVPKLSRRVLIVDDDIVTRKTLSAFLRKLHFKGTTSSSYWYHIFFIFIFFEFLNSIPTHTHTLTVLRAVVTAEGARQALKLLHINAYLGELTRQKRLSVDDGVTPAPSPLSPPTPDSIPAAKKPSAEAATGSVEHDLLHHHHHHHKHHQQLQEAIDSAVQEEQEEAQEISEDDVGGEFDLLLIDVMMPDIDGIELLKVFKKATTDDIPIIMISSSEDPDVISQSFKSGAEDFLNKPIRFDLLKRRVEMCLEDRMRRKQESQYREKLRSEREARNMLTKQVREQEKQLEQMRLHISDAIETPIQVVMKTISDLMKGSHGVEQYKGALLALMKSLGSRDLYRPSFSTALDHHQDMTLDDTTKKWLVTEFMNEQASVDHQRSLTPEQKEARRQQAPRKNSLPESLIVRSTFISLDSKHCFDEKGQFKNTIKDLESFAFDIFAYEQDEMILNTAFMFEDLGLIEKFSIHRGKLLAFLRRVRQLYRDNPYHNFTHALDVTQFCYACLCLDRVAAALVPLDMLAMLLASVCHDIDHPGLNNNYQVNARTDLALMYNDMSVLENYHCSTMFQLLRQREYNFLSAMPQPQFRELRKCVISAILATDMAHHFEISTKFQTRLQSGPISKDHPDDRQMFVNIILKCADISNVVRPFDVCHRWADMLIEEFANQGDLEHREGMPISPNMDRSQIVKPKFQLSFIDFIAVPLYKNVAGYISGLQPVVDQLNVNRSVWKMIMRQEEHLPISTEITDGGNEPEDNTPPITSEHDQVISQTAKLKGFRILVLQQSASASKMIADILDRVGFEYDLAHNEQEAAEAISKHSYDIVIADMVNKFLVVIKQIRANDHEEHKVTPIIALIPPSQQSEMSHFCSEHNVDSCLVKPAPVQQFISTIENLIAVAIQKGPVVDMGIAVEQCGGEKEFVEELLADFVEHAAEQIQAIEQAIAERDWKILELNAHSIKGAAAQLAAKPTSQAAFSLEKAAKQKNPDYLERDLHTLKKRFSAVTDFVESGGAR